MKTIKTIVILLLFITLSCDAVEDKVCDVAIDQVKDEYKEWILEIQNDSNLTEEEIEEEINYLNQELQEEIALLKEDCDFF